ncbi:MAG: GNAT family N-acetyltransferase [Alphaproteobacteria bacterium]|nr:GNAT family N-acetyltransferase [Alphaproteobacteria bacterium]
MTALAWRAATLADVPLLARWNMELNEDEGHPPWMEPTGYATRMAGFLEREGYAATLFEIAGTPIGYALHRREPEGQFLRQFYIARDRRRSGLGRAAFALLRGEVWPRGVPLGLDVLSGNARGFAFWRSLGFRDHATRLVLK